MQIDKKWASIKFRYSIITIILALVVLYLSFFTYKTVSSAQFHARQKLEATHEFRQTLQRIHSNIQYSNNLLDSFLISPDNVNIHSAAHSYIDQSLNDLERLSAELNQTTSQFSTLLNVFEQEIENYHQKMHHLFSVRLDSIHQYPALAIGDDIMRPNRVKIIDNFTIIMNYLSDVKMSDTDSRLYREFVDLRYLWSQTLSNFRLYLANRVGSFDLESLPLQERSIRTSFQGIQEKLDALQQLDEKGELEFEVSDALEMINEGLNGWNSGFEKVVTVHQSGRWRLDVTLMNNEIIPALLNISSLLEALERGIGDLNQFALDEIAAATRLQTTTLSAAAFIILLTFAISVVSVYRFILKPVGDVAQALTGDRHLSIGYKKSEEAEVLVSAYNEMVRRVKERQDELEYLALHDTLTNLPNRSYLNKSIQTCIDEAVRHNQQFSLLIIDLDHFKEINDSLGHDIGDKLLIQVGMRLHQVLFGRDLVARLGGDEFAVLLSNVDMNRTIEVCRKLKELVQDIFHVDDYELYVGLSIGVASYPIHGENISTLLRHADVAMYNAKRNKRSYAVYDPDLDESNIRQLATTKALREAINSNALSLRYQPIFSLDSETVTGVEALLRWENNKYELMTEKIIEIAEHTGLIVPLTYWVLEQVAKDSERLIVNGRLLDISVNVSAYSLRDPQFCDRIMDILTDQKVAPSRIRIEITESAMMENTLHDDTMLSQLKKKHFRLAVDDFGVGYSSLAYLRKLPITDIKLDKSFIIDMHQNYNNRTIVNSTVELAKNLGLTVTAEGIESKEIYDLLNNMGCDYAQGYYLSRPMSLDKFDETFNSKAKSENLVLS